LIAVRFGRLRIALQKVASIDTGNFGAPKIGEGEGTLIGCSLPSVVLNPPLRGSTRQRICALVNNNNNNNQIYNFILLFTELQMRWK